MYLMLHIKFPGHRSTCYEEEKLLIEAYCKHRALARNNMESQKLRIWLKFWEIDIHNACLHFTRF